MNRPILPLLLVEHLSKTVRDATQPIDILRDINLAVACGESVAIQGASGSGKSTLLSIVAGLDTPSEGRVMVQGQAFSNLDEDARAKRRAACMGFVFQNFELLQHMTALENVALPLALLGRWPAREAASMAREMLAQVGLSDHLHHYPRVLSGGEQQRVALARALVSRPALLLADEPTGALDHATGRRVTALLFDLVAKSGASLLIVTHDERLAAACDRVFTLREGMLHAT